MSTHIQQYEDVQMAATPPSSWLAAWLPSPQQMRDAVQLRFGSAPPRLAPAAPPPAGTPSEPSPAVAAALPEAVAQVSLSQRDVNSTNALDVPTISTPPASSAQAEPPVDAAAIDARPIRTPLDITMRQGLGLICAAALIAGLIPFVWNWTQAASVGTALPLAQTARAWAQSDAAAIPNTLPNIIGETAQVVAGLPPRAPAGLAAFLSALGEWLNWPMRWLAVWIVYGLGVIGMALLLGARTTLQHFYAATSYAFIPLLLGGLAFIPVLGWLLGLAAVTWAVVVYFHATRAITGLDTLRVVISMIAPAALGALAFLLVAMMVVNVVWSLI